MSAIAGMIRFDGHPVEPATLQRMQTLLAPYGRDAQQSWQQDSAGLLRTLLRTTPEDNLDQQPLLHAPSQTVLLFDGRLDNREELAHKLGLRKDEIALMADSAVALQACLRWDTAAVKHLLGDFTLACWQPARRRLWLARDPMGIRPLFWHRQAGFFAFASMPKALFAIPGVPRALCEERLHDFICLFPIPGPESLFKDVYRVEPGQLVVLEGERLSTRRYHDFNSEREIRLSSDDEYVEAFREQLERAVACRLRANGPIAAQLSSGFDSSTVTAVAARQLALQGKDLLAYTAVPRAGYDGAVPRGRHADESIGAGALAARFPNIKHILIRPDGTSPLDLLQAKIDTLDRPPLNPCNMVWMDAIHNDAAGRGARVLLNGQRGNATISYTGEYYLPSLLGQGRWISWWREAAALKSRQPGRRWRGLLAQSVAPYLPLPIWRAWMQHRGQQTGLTDFTAIHPGFMARMHHQQRARVTGADPSYRPMAKGRHMRIAMLSRMDLGEHAAAANAMGLDLRDPTGDLRLAEFCLSVPDRQYLRKGENRWLLRRLVGDMLPPEILHAETKGLQAADWHEAFSAMLPKARAELESMIAHGGIGAYLDLDTLLHSLETWPVHNTGMVAHMQTFRMKLLRGLAVGAFIRHVASNRTI